MQKVEFFRNAEKWQLKMEQKIERVHQPLPQEYKAPKRINFCGNLIENFQFLIEEYGFVPILVGEREIPRVWLYVKLKNKALSVVRDNIAVLTPIKVNIFLKERKINIESYFNSLSNRILEVDFSTEILTITFLDLNVLGYNITGDNQSLKFGSGKIEGNHFVGLQTVLKIENSSR